MRRLLGAFICIVFLLSPASAYAGVELPSSHDCSLVVRHTAYTLCYDEQHEQARWTVYRLTREMLAYKCRRSDNFHEDPLVKTGSASPEDYRGSGYDKGHLVPANDMRISAQCMSETFCMSNMSPQAPSFNRGIWKRLEEKVRQWAQEDEEICVVTGPVLADEGMKTIGRGRVAVPFRFYKVILDYREPELKAIAFIIPNAKAEADLPSYAVTVDEAEDVTGIDFFPALPDKVEEEIESRIEIDRWFPDSGNSRRTGLH